MVKQVAVVMVVEVVAELVPVLMIPLILYKVDLVELVVEAVAAE
jgi:hypothetical protein